MAQEGGKWHGTTWGKNCPGVDMHHLIKQGPKERLIAPLTPRWGVLSSFRPWTSKLQDLQHLESRNYTTSFPGFEICELGLSDATYFLAVPACKQPAMAFQILQSQELVPLVNLFSSLVLFLSSSLLVLHLPRILTNMHNIYSIINR